MKPLIEIVTREDGMIPCLLWKGYQDGNICLVILKFLMLRIFFTKGFANFLAKTLYML